MPRACMSKRTCKRGALFRGRRCEASPQLLAPGIRTQLAAGLGIDQPEHSRVRELLFTRIPDLDSHHLVSAGELEQGLAPVLRPAEVADHDHHGTLLRKRAGPAESFAERGHAVLVRWLAATRAAIADCECRAGCPSCVQSPKCGNGNNPLDKDGAITVLDVVLHALAR